MTYAKNTKQIFEKWRGEVEKRMRNQKVSFQPQTASQKEEQSLDDLHTMQGEMLTGNEISYMHPSDGGNTFVISGRQQASPVYPLTAGYFMSDCREVIELPDGESFILVFDPYDVEGLHHTEICLTVQKKIKRSEALGELLFAFGTHEGLHSDSSLLVDNVAAFRELFEGKQVGIEVSENPATGWLYITDFFNLVGTDELPSCHNDIVRNEF